MMVQNIKPVNKELQQYISHFWVLKIGKIQRRVPPVMPVEPFSDLLLNFGDPIIWRGMDNVPQLKTSSYLCGLQKKPYRLEPHGEIDYLGIRFFPHGLYPFLNIPMSETSHRLIDMDVLPWNLSNYLAEKIFHLPDTTQKAALLEIELLKLLKSNTRQTSPFSLLLNHALQSIHCSGGATTIQKLCNQLDIHHKKLEREFKKRIGVTPKFYARVVRFNHALAHIQRKGKKIDNWWDIVFEYGYFDQAHFIKEFITFMGQSPESYCKTGFATSEVS